MSVGDREVTKVERWVRNAAGELVLMQVDQPSDAVAPGRIGQRSYRCVICGFTYKEHDTVMFRGKPYGRPCGCYKDISSILRSEHSARRRTANEGRK